MLLCTYHWLETHGMLSMDDDLFTTLTGKEHKAALFIESPSASTTDPDGVAGLFGKTMGCSHWLVSAAETQILPSFVVNPWQL